MLRIAIISPDTELATHLHRVLVDTGRVLMVRIVESYPDPMDLTRMLRSYMPGAVFLDVESTEQSIVIASQIEAVRPGVPVVAVARSCEPSTLMEIMEAGINEYLAAPFEYTCVNNCLSRISNALSPCFA